MTAGDAQVACERLTTLGVQVVRTESGDYLTAWGKQQMIDFASDYDRLVAAEKALAEVKRNVRALHIAGLIDNHATHVLLTAIEMSTGAPDA